MRQSLRVTMVLCGLVSASFAAAQTPAKVEKSIKVGHEGLRISVAFAPDGKTLATGGGDNHIRLWDLPSGKLRRAFRAYNAPAGVSRLVFLPDGTTLASGGWAGDGAVKLWNTATGVEQRLVGKNAGGVNVVSVAPNGTLLAWKSTGKIHLFDLSTNKETRTLPLRNAVDSVAFSPDGALLAAATGSGNVQVWETASGKDVRDLPARASIVTGSQGVAFSPDGKTIATAGDGVRLFDAATGEGGTPLPLDEEALFCIAYSPNRRFLAIGGYKTLHLWDTTAKKEVRRWEERAYSVAFSKEGDWLAFGRADGATLISLDPPGK